MKSLWEEVKNEILSIKTLERKKEEEICLGSGNEKGGIFFIGDEIDLYDDSGFGMISESSGEFLKKLCTYSNIDIKNIFITSLTKCNIHYREVFENEKKQLLDYTYAQIAIIKPKLIVTLGQEVSSIFLGKGMKINEIRGKVYNWKGGIKLIPIYSPKYLLDKSREKGSPSWHTWQDMKLILEIYKNEQ